MVGLHSDIVWQLGPLSVYTLGVSLALGFLTATVVAIPHLRRRGIRRLQVLRLMLALMLFSVLGARIAAVAFGRNGDPISGASFYSIPPDGLAYYGGVVTALGVLVVFCAQQRWPLLLTTDALAPAAALGMTVGLSVPLGTNLLHLRSEGPLWLNLIVFTAAYGGTYLLWRHSQRTRFPGELTLLLLAGDSLLRLLFGAYWAYGHGGVAAGTSRGPLVMLAVVAVLWFSFRGAAQRRSRSALTSAAVFVRTAAAEAAGGQAEAAAAASRSAVAGWAFGYAVLAVLILARLYAI